MDFGMDFIHLVVASQVRWLALGQIAASWFASPILSGTMSAIIFWMIRKFILRSDEPLERSLSVLPTVYGVTVAVNVMSVAMDGPKCNDKVVMILPKNLFYS